MALSEKKIPTLPIGRHLDGGDHGRGLYLQITKNGASWLFRYEIESATLKSGAPTKPNGRTGRRERWMGLGSLQARTLKQARAKAKEMRLLLSDGIDPLKAREDEKAATALAEAKKINIRESGSSLLRTYTEEMAKRETPRPVDHVFDRLCLSVDR